jgi:hypothetical protein
MTNWFLALALTTVGIYAGEVDDAQQQIVEACGHKVGIEIRWEAFGNDTDGRNTFSSQGLSFLGTAMKGVCADAKLKSAFKAQVSSIVISQAYGAADPYIYVNERKLHLEYLWVKGEPGPDSKVVAAEIASRLRGEDPAPP